MTFKRFAQLAEDHPNLVTRTPYVYVWNDGSTPFDPWYKDLVFDVRCLSINIYVGRLSWFYGALVCSVPSLIPH